MIKINIKYLILAACAIFCVAFWLGVHSSFSDKLIEFYTIEEQTEAGYKLVDCDGDADCFQKNGF